MANIFKKITLGAYLRPNLAFEFQESYPSAAMLVPTKRLLGDFGVGDEIIAEEVVQTYQDPLTQ